jgi:hypothetical protein
VSSALQRYNPQQVREILRRAQQQDRPEAPAEEISRAELIETAREVGLDVQSVEKALTEYDQEVELVPVKQELRQLAWRRFSMHLIFYGVAVALALTAGPVAALPIFFIAPLIIWGVLVLFHLRGVLFPHPDRLREQAIARLERRRLKESGKAFGKSVTRGAARLLSVTARKIDAEVDRLAGHDRHQRR